MTFDPEQVGIAFFYSLAAMATGISISLLPFLLVLLLCALPLLFASQTYRKRFGVVVAFAFIGTFLGMFSGTEPFAGVMLPTTIILISGCTVYFFDRRSGSNPIFDVAAVPVLLSALVVAASFGACYAGTIRMLSMRTEIKLEGARESIKAEHSELEARVNGAKLCLDKFSIWPEMQKSCAELLKSK